MARNVLVTGSSHGIGAATAIAFAKQGCNVGIVYCKTKEGAEQTAAACREYGGDIQIFKADLSVRAECEKLMADFLEHYKTIDVLINDAGGALKIPKGEFVDMPLDYWDSQIALNLNAAAYLTQGAIRNMKENNHPRPHREHRFGTRHDLLGAQKDAALLRREGRRRDVHQGYRR